MIQALKRRYELEALMKNKGQYIDTTKFKKEDINLLQKLEFEPVLLVRGRLKALRSTNLAKHPSYNI